MTKHVSYIAVILAPAFLLAGQNAPPAPSFDVTFDAKVLNAPFTGRVFIIASKQPIKDQPQRISWFKPEPFFAKDVQGWIPGEPLMLGEEMLGYPASLAELPPGKYHVQAVLDMDQGGQNCLTAAGNLYSKPILVELSPKMASAIRLTVDQVVPERKFQETAQVKLVDIESPLLTKFHGKPMRLRAGVVLPASFAKNPGQRYPVVYEIPGFGGDHFGAFAAEARKATEVAGLEMIHVVLDPACRLGHHVFADSDNNGPCGQALVRELIPVIEKTYRGLGTASSRFVTGHSSGGWSSLWLQVAHADFFGGVWATAPDPVDFRDFQKVNIYGPRTNLFTDTEGKPRPLAHKKESILLWYKGFSDLETVMGRGGQLASFEAVFSPKGKDGQPMKLWDRKTGSIDPAVAKTWERYDLRLFLERHWADLSPKLAGKIHVYMGEEDTFYLEGATLLLKESLQRLGSDAVVEIFAGRDHFTLLNQELRQRIAREIAEAFRRSS